MRFASAADVKNSLAEYLARAQGKNESLEWRSAARKRLSKAWEGEDDSLYDYL